MNPLTTQTSTYADFRLLTVGRDSNLGELLVDEDGGLKCVNNHKYTWIPGHSNNVVYNPQDTNNLKETFADALKSEIDRLGLPNADELKKILTRHFRGGQTIGIRTAGRGVKNSREHIGKLILNFEAMRDGLISPRKFIESVKNNELLSKGAIDRLSKENRPHLLNGLRAGGNPLTPAQTKTMKKLLSKLNDQQLRLFKTQIHEMYQRNPDADFKQLTAIATCFAKLKPSQLSIAGDYGPISMMGINYQLSVSHPGAKKLEANIKELVSRPKQMKGYYSKDVWNKPFSFDAHFTDKLTSGKLDLQIDGKKTVNAADAERKFAKLFGDELKHLGHYFCHDDAFRDMVPQNFDPFPELPKSLFPNGTMYQANNGNNDGWHASFKKKGATVEITLSVDTHNIGSLGDDDNKVEYTAENTNISTSVKLLVTLPDPNGANKAPQISLVSGPKISGDLDIAKLAHR